MVVDLPIVIKQFCVQCHCIDGLPRAGSMVLQSAVLARSSTSVLGVETLEPVPLEPLSTTFGSRTVCCVS